MHLMARWRPAGSIGRTADTRVGGYPGDDG